MMYTDSIRRWATDLRRSGTLANPDGIGEIGLKDGQAGTRPAARFAVTVCGDRVDQVRFLAVVLPLRPVLPQQTWRKGSI
jgi:nitrogen fixation protein NifQ